MNATTKAAETPTLSVIMPTYNRSGYVRQCLRSLRACRAPGLEVIVADDGSTDDTAQVVAETDPRAVYFRQENTSTPATARNRGFELSRGRYVAFLDCDDEWLPGVASRAVELLDRYPEVDVLFAEARMGNPTEGYRPDPEAVRGLPLDLYACLDETAGDDDAPGATGLSRLQERFRSYWGVAPARVQAVGHVARAWRADAVFVVGLNVLP
jgi:glycosyltransferase involved in cell wall biosynthesis